MEERGRAILRPEADGSVTLLHSWTEMGQGIHTALAQVAAEELRIPLDRVRVQVDTIRELDTGETTASRATLLGGQAVIEAARRLNQERGGRELAELAGREFLGEHVIDWTTALSPDDPDPVTHVAYGWATQVVILDDEGGLARVVAAQDVGRVINRLSVEGQVEGGVHMGLGYALSEDFPTDELGRPTNMTFRSLGIIRPKDVPEIDVVLVECPQPGAPYGVKGVGEIGLVPTAGAVAAALHDRDGGWRTSLPMGTTVARLEEGA